MPRVFDNVNLKLIDSLTSVLAESYAADFCVGYFHLRGWSGIQPTVAALEGGPNKQARILVGMNATDEAEMQDSLSVLEREEFRQKQQRIRHTAIMEKFNRQLAFGLPSTAAEASIQGLLHQLKEGRVAVKLFTRYPLHAKLYLLHRHVSESELFAFVGSSNLTAPGLYNQGELNLDVQDQTACQTLSKWFLDRWNDQFSIDATVELQQVIEESWAAERLFSPYHVYLKIARHLAYDAIEASLEYKLPHLFEGIVLDFQADAIVRCRRYLHRHPLAILADVVGMGKTLAASAVAKLFQDEEGGRCIVCCPVKLQKMWQEYLAEYEIIGEVVPYSQTDKLAELKGRCRLMILDESHNLRNREIKTWANIRDYIHDQDAKVLLLSATPYNKHFEDLGNQLRLAIDEKETDLGCKPEAYFRKNSEVDFAAKYQAPSTSLIAFEQSESPDDWADLLKHFLVRRTRDFIIRNYAEYDEDRKRHYIVLKTDGTRSYFPRRVPITLPFPLDSDQPSNQYARLLSDDVEQTIDHLSLPRYGLGLYVDPETLPSADVRESELLDNLSTAGPRLIGYCRKNLFKRLESSGYSFLLSLKRHALRNYVFIHAIDNGLDLPIGTQDSVILDTATSDADADSDIQTSIFDIESELDAEEPPEDALGLSQIQTRAKAVYASYAADRRRRPKQFRWLSSRFFRGTLREDLVLDAEQLLRIVKEVGEWQPSGDTKIAALAKLLKTKEKQSKVLLFSQFADTALYVCEQLKARGVDHVECSTAAQGNPYDLVRRFSPSSNLHKLTPTETPIRVLVATEVLSEGQNCQDANVVINYDLPWAIIRLIQRAGRVDRIGQENDEIRIYSCLPSEGVERLIQLRQRLVDRLETNREVIGTDERFFEEEQESIRNLYAEDPSVLEGLDDDSDVDIPSRAKAIWENALKLDPAVEQVVEDLPPQVFATRPNSPSEENPNGALVYFRTADGFDGLGRIDANGKVLTQSITAVLRMAECEPDTESLPRHRKHHDLVATLVKEAIRRQYVEAGALGDRRSTRRRVHERLSGHLHDLKSKHDLFSKQDTADLEGVLNDIFRNPMTENARRSLSNRIREGVSDATLAELAITLRDHGALVIQATQVQAKEPELICSIGLFPKSEVAKS